MDMALPSLIKELAEVVGDMLEECDGR